MAEWNLMVRIFEEEFNEYVDFDRRTVILHDDANVNDLVESCFNQHKTSANIRREDFEMPVVFHFDKNFKKVMVQESKRLESPSVYAIDLRRIHEFNVSVTVRVDSSTMTMQKQLILQLSGRANVKELVEKLFAKMKNPEKFEVIDAKYRRSNSNEEFCVEFSEKVDNSLEYIINLTSKVIHNTSSMSKFTLTSCPNNLRSRAEVRIALDVAVRLGLFYDAKTDKFCKDFSVPEHFENYHERKSKNMPLECTIGDVEDCFELLGVKMVQKLSIQSELCEPGIFNDFNRATSGTSEKSFLLVCKNISHVDEMNMNNLYLLKDLFKNQRFDDTTHVVSSIGYGAVVFVVFTPKNSIAKTEYNIAEAREAIFRECNNLQLSAASKAIIEELDMQIDIKFWSYPQLMLPSMDATVREALRFVKEIPQKCKDIDAPIFFEITALENIIDEKYLTVNNYLFEKFENVKAITSISQLLGSFKRLSWQLESVNEVIMTFDYALTGDDKLAFDHFECTFREDFEKVLDTCQKLVRQMRSEQGDLDTEYMQMLLHEKRSCLKRYETYLSSGKKEFCLLNAFKKMQIFYPILHKIEIAKFCRQRNVPFVSDIVELQKEIQNLADIKTYFVFFQRTSQMDEPEDIAENLELFNKLLDDDEKCIFYSVSELELELQNTHKNGAEFQEVELDKESELYYLTQRNTFVEEREWTQVLNELQKFICNQLSTKCSGLIVKVRGTKSLTLDYLSAMKDKRNVSLAKCDIVSYNNARPSTAIPLQIRCPFSSVVPGGRCPDEEHRWQCDDCSLHIYYNTETENNCDSISYLYCGCGCAPMHQFKFRCRNVCKHTDQFVSIDKNTQEILLNEMRGFGKRLLLVLGESGVGKSTWINAIVNYLRHHSLNEAMGAKNFECLIPTMISTTTTNDDEPQMICVEKSEEHCAQNNDNMQHSESLSMGKSQTKHVKAYDIAYKDGTLTILDNPGTCDTDGPEKDQEHLENTNAFIEMNVEKLDAICIVLKPNYERNTAYLLYCINQLLTYLHKSAAKNIIFCFTYSRSTLFEPGNTIHFLRRVFEGVKTRGIDVRLTPQNMFYMDNEAFRLLCKLQKGIRYSDEELKQCTKSWENSRRETFRLFKYIESVRPHCSFATLSLNSKRRKMTKLMKPFIEILQTLKTKLLAISIGEMRIIQLNEEKEDLKSSPTSTRRVIASRPLNYYRTVCIEANEKCAQIRSDENGKKILYHSTVCHDHCDCVENSAENTYPHPPLQKCSAIVVRNNQYRCSVCDCLWDKHMHVRFEQFEETVTMTDQELLNQVQIRTNEIMETEKRNSEIRKEVDELENEKNKIEEVLQKLAVYINQNAILPFNDAICDYIQMVVLDEKGELERDNEKIARFVKFEAEYQEQEIIMKNGLTNDTTVDVLNLRITIENLFLLPRYGNMISRLLADEQQRIS